MFCLMLVWRIAVFPTSSAAFCSVFSCQALSVEIAPSQENIAAPGHWIDCGKTGIAVHILLGDPEDLPDTLDLSYGWCSSKQFCMIVSYMLRLVCDANKPLLHRQNCVSSADSSKQQGPRCAAEGETCRGPEPSAGLEALHTVRVIPPLGKPVTTVCNLRRSYQRCVCPTRSVDVVIALQRTEFQAIQKVNPKVHTLFCCTAPSYRASL